MATGGEDLMRAVVIGGTGATGKCLVGLLLKAKDKVDKVTLISRRKLENVGPEYGVDIGAEEKAGRLQQHVEDLNDISDDTVKQLCTGSHVFFNCLGTTLKQAGSADNFKHVDYEIPIRLINLARQVNVPHCCIVTAKQSDFLPSSWFLYLRTKKEFEKSVGDLKFNHTSIFRPGVLERGEVARLHEKILGLVCDSLSVATLAEGMVTYAWNCFSSNQTPAENVVVLNGNPDIRGIKAGKKSQKQIQRNF